MKIGFTMTKGKGDTDLLLSRFANALIENGGRPVGTIQINTDCSGTDVCDMDIQVLPDGPSFRISQSLGSGSRGCRLNASALEEVVGYTSNRLSEDADCLIVNKFGKQEADGRGFRPVIADAIQLGLPVIVGINRTNLDAFNEFTGGGADQIAPDIDALRAWLNGKT